MNVEVTYRAQLKRALGRASERVTLAPDATLRDLLVLVATGAEPGAQTLLLDETRHMRRSLLAFVGPEQADDTRRLRDGDHITLLAPMAGG